MKPSRFDPDSFDRSFKLAQNITVAMFIATLFLYVGFVLAFCAACVAVIVAYT